MGERALEFSQLGDASFARLAARFPHAMRRRLALEQKVEAHRMEQLRHSTLGFLGAVLGCRGLPDDDEALAVLRAVRGAVGLDGGVVLPQRAHAVEFNVLHKAMAALLREHRLDECVDGIDLPINVRMVSGKPGHSAAFGLTPGMPADAVTVILPVLGTEDVTLDLAELPVTEELKALGSGAIVQGLTLHAYSDMPLRNGHLYVLDARLPRRLVGPVDGLRVWLEFSFRRPDRGFRAVTTGESERMATRYLDWLAVGTDQLLVVEPRQRGAVLHDVAAVDAIPYRLLPLG